METIMRSDLSKGLRRKIREKESELDRKCRLIWEFTNSNNERYMFGSFCKNRNRLCVTIAYYAPYVGWIPENLGR